MPVLDSVHKKGDWEISLDSGDPNFNLGLHLNPPKVCMQVYMCLSAHMPICLYTCGSCLFVCTWEHACSDQRTVSGVNSQALSNSFLFLPKFSAWPGASQARLPGRPGSSLQH